MNGRVSGTAAFRIWAKVQHHANVRSPWLQNAQCTIEPALNVLKGCGTDQDISMRARPFAMHSTCLNSSQRMLPTHQQTCYCEHLLQKHVIFGTSEQAKQASKRTIHGTTHSIRRPRTPHLRFKKHLFSGSRGTAPLSLPESSLEASKTSYKGLTVNFEYQQPERCPHLPSPLF